MKQTILAALLLMPIISFAQQEQSQTKKIALTTAAVSGAGAYVLSKQIKKPEGKVLGSYLKLRDEVIYHSPSPRFMTRPELTAIKGMIKKGDKIVVVPGKAGELINQRAVTLANSSPEALEKLIDEIGLTQDAYVGSITKVNNEFRIKLLRRTTTAQVALAAISITSVGVAVANWNSGNNKKAASRFNSSRSLIEKTGPTSHDMPIRKAANVTRQ